MTLYWWIHVYGLTEVCVCVCVRTQQEREWYHSASNLLNWLHPDQGEAETCYTLWFVSLWRGIHTAAGLWPQTHTHLKASQDLLERSLPKKTKKAWPSWTFFHSHQTSTPSLIYPNKSMMHKTEEAFWVITRSSLEQCQIMITDNMSHQVFVESSWSTCCHQSKSWTNQRDSEIHQQFQRFNVLLKLLNKNTINLLTYLLYYIWNICKTEVPWQLVSDFWTSL